MYYIGKKRSMEEILVRLGSWCLFSFCDIWKGFRLWKANIQKFNSKVTLDCDNFCLHQTSNDQCCLACHGFRSVWVFNLTLFTVRFQLQWAFYVWFAMACECIDPAMLPASLLMRPISQYVRLLADRRRCFAFPMVKFAVCCLDLRHWQLAAYGSILQMHAFYWCLLEEVCWKLIFAIRDAPPP